MCIQCFEVGPPPNSIVSMPPPPLPSFLVPKTALIALTQNDSQPCFAAHMCDSPRSREQSGLEYIELPGKSFNDAWLFVVVASLVGIILLITVLTFMLMKCREENEQKHLPPKNMCHTHEPHVSMDKSQTFMPGTILFPCPSSEDVLQQETNKDNRLLWATLTPHGTRHFVSSAGDYTNYEDHYEIVDYTKPIKTTPKKNPNKSFDNSGFSDLDYEDMHSTTATDIYHDDHDSGYQEPHEVIGSLNRNLNSSRLLVSSPTRIENPNIPPLNIHPHRMHGNSTTTLNKKSSTLTRRTTETLNYYGNQGSNI